MKLYCTYFNFCREHAGLEYEDKIKVKRKNTPARECGIQSQSGNQEIR
jgi:hypothetical protein